MSDEPRQITAAEIHEIKQRQLRLEKQIRMLSKQLASMNKQFHDNVEPLLEVLMAAQGAFKVLSFVYKVGKPLIFVGSLITAGYTWWSKFK